MKEYVAGFLFCGEYVALVRKIEPAWQKDLWNAIGGKIEEGESPLEAMEREFKEETGITGLLWQEVVILTDERGWKVHFFRAYDVELVILPPANDRGESLIWRHYQMISECIPNLEWLLPFCLRQTVVCPIIVVER